MNATQAASLETVDADVRILRLRIYVGEDKRHGDQLLYRAIVLTARQLQMAGATVVPGKLGYGRSTRLHTTQVVFCEDLPVVIEMIDREDKIMRLVPLLSGLGEVGLVTCDEVRVLPGLPAA